MKNALRALALCAVLVAPCAGAQAVAAVLEARRKGSPQ